MPLSDWMSILVGALAVAGLGVVLWQILMMALERLKEGHEKRSEMLKGL
jgi:hypothetical protein